MNRNKELRKIEAALLSKHKEEIDWALSYCKMRIKHARLKVHIKHWEKLIDQLNKVAKTEE